MVRIKTQQEIERLKSGGKILAQILRELMTYCMENYDKSGFTTLSIDKKCEELIRKNKVIASFKNYSSHGSDPYPASICVSVNEEVVHGIPGKRVLKSGDSVNLDLGVIYDGLYTDAAITFILGSARRPEDKMLVDCARDSLYKGIEKAVVGNTIGDIGNAIESYVKEIGFRVVRDYCGHGVGYGVHEDPLIPNYGIKGQGTRLEEGMVLAIEPMVVIGSPEVYIDKNGWTVKTADNKPTSHWEHTIAVTAKGPVILTE